ncbi:MAG: DUF6531 domain-containing protein [Azoarcus sp.]|jgi:YD repeat-containing protein|nr:DUF6531 domain-containing protein [Azoarcus sp.]
MIAIVIGATSNIYAQELPYGSKKLYQAAICSNCWGLGNTSVWHANKVNAIQESVNKYLTGVVSDYMLTCNSNPGASRYHAHPRYEQVYWTLDEKVVLGNEQIFTIWGNNDYRINCFGLTDDYVLYTGGVRWVTFDTPNLVGQNNGIREGACVGDPVVPYTGEQTITENDFVDPANSDLDFKRFWISGRAVPGDFKDKSFSNLGTGWTHNHEIGLFFSADDVLVADWFGRTYNFTKISPDSLNFNSSKPGASLTASHPASNPNAIEFEFKDGETSDIYIFNSDGYLTQKYFNGKLLLTYHYNNGKLSNIANPFGKTLQFNYDVNGRILNVTLPDQTQVTFSYEEDSFLSSVHYQDGSKKSYLREDSRFTNLISGVKDEASFRFNYFKYDAYGRSVSTEFSNGIGKYQLSYYNHINVGALQTSVRVTSPAGDYRSYGYSIKAGTINIYSPTLAPYDPAYPPITSSVLSDAGLILQNRNILGVIN